MVNLSSSNIYITGDITITKTETAEIKILRMERKASTSSLSVGKKNANPIKKSNNKNTKIKCVFNTILRFIF